MFFWKSWVLIKVAVWEINYQKGQCIYKEVYFILKSIFSPILANNNGKLLGTPGVP